MYFERERIKKLLPAVSPAVEALPLAMLHVPLGGGGRRLQILVEIHLPQFHQNICGGVTVADDLRIDDPHDVLTLDKEQFCFNYKVLNPNANARRDAPGLKYFYTPARVCLTDAHKRGRGT